MKSRSSTVRVLRIRDNETGEVKQCMDAHVASYDTLCGYALEDEICEGRATLIKRGEGRVTCPQCLQIIDAVLNG